jgi:predicted acyltransferase
VVKTRNESVDALRGFAVLTMVLSGSIAFGDVLPAWMYHAQVPPPDHTFNPAIPGITWVDLVFPFFLFSMGAAIPLSFQAHFQTGAPRFTVLAVAARRLVLLAFLPSSPST